MRKLNYSDTANFHHIEAAVPALPNRVRDALGQPTVDGHD